MPSLVLKYNWVLWRLRLFVITWVVTIEQLVGATHVRPTFFLFLEGGIYLLRSEFLFEEYIV